MREPLMVAVAQPPCVAHDVAANAWAHASAIRTAGARVVVFPELSLTGYELDAAPVDPGDERLQPIVAACADTGTVALAGAPVTGALPAGAPAPTAPTAPTAPAAPGAPAPTAPAAPAPSPASDNSKRNLAPEVFIGVLAIDAGGVSVVYRKMWLGEEEARRFSPGPAPAKLTVDGWRLGLAVCRETGVAQHAADTAALGIDAYLAGTVMAPDEAEKQNERGRRISTDHHLWVALASFAGPTGGGYDQTAGQSGIWAPDGTQVSASGPRPGAVSRASLRAAILS
ncbi:MAG TPA: carbon-nitrogen hydrolase family protein [Streptosporangiaceae bacterium]|jgi:predicted amidohydrolase